MNKIDKKIIDSIDLLSKTMIKNNLSGIEISDGDFSIKLKKFIKDNQVLKNNEVFEKCLKLFDKIGILEFRKLVEEVDKNFTEKNIRHDSLLMEINVILL